MADMESTEKGRPVLALTDPMIWHESVMVVQQYLNDHYGANLVIDGWYGKGTRDWVKHLQHDNGLTVDGKVGGKTWSLIERQADPVKPTPEPDPTPDPDPQPKPDPEPVPDPTPAMPPRAPTGLIAGLLALGVAIVAAVAWFT